MCSARSFFSFAFSSSSAFDRLASETSMPPNLAFQSAKSPGGKDPAGRRLRFRGWLLMITSHNRSLRILVGSLQVRNFGILDRERSITAAGAKNRTTRDLNGEERARLRDLVRKALKERGRPGPF